MYIDEWTYEGIRFFLKSWILIPYSCNEIKKLIKNEIFADTTEKRVSDFSNNALTSISANSPVGKSSHWETETRE